MDHWSKYFVCSSSIWSEKGGKNAASVPSREGVQNWDHP